MIKRIFIAIIFIFLNFYLQLRAEEIASIINLSKDDRILILAPHPDDETIGTGGVIQKALNLGAKVKIVCFTNGDHNQLAFIIYEKRLTFRKGEFLHMGELRRKETLAAMSSLGLSRDNIIFLGYPDFGTMEILTKYWGKTKPFKNMLTRISKVSYPEAMSVNAPYVGESIIKDLKSIILDFKPTKIFVSHPADTNRDHQSLYLFLQVALWDLAGQIDQPQIFPYIIHVVGWPKPRGYHPDLELEPPNKLTEVLWQKLPLSEEDIKVKHNAISFYKSQIECDPPYLFSFARKNELFGDYSIIKLKKQEVKEIYWQDLKIDKNIEKDLIAKEENQKGRISALAYAYQDNDIFIRLNLKRKIDKDFGISIFLIGYNKKTDFAQMPKIHLMVGMSGLHIKDKKQILFIKDAQLRYEGKTLIIKIPLSSLGNPDYILSSAKTKVGDLPLDETAWRIIDLE